MGLNVTVINNLKLVPEDEAYFEAYVIDDLWNHKIRNIWRGGLYDGDVIASAAGYAYSTHSRFREYLVRLTETTGILDKNGEIIWDKIFPQMPFYDFIDFADNEGCFDWETSAGILKEFDLYSERNESQGNERMKSIYKDWHKAIRISANQMGVVVFR